LRALESKLELITLQRNVSAVKCEIFLPTFFEAHRRKGRQLPGMPSGVPPWCAPWCTPWGTPPCPRCHYRSPPPAPRGPTG